MDHNWATIAPGEDDALMCTVCCQCQCCETPSEECPGAWVPEEDDGFWKGPSDAAREALRKWLESKYPERDRPTWRVAPLRITTCEECGYRKSVTWDTYFKSVLCDSCWVYLTEREEREKDG